MAEILVKVPEKLEEEIMNLEINVDPVVINSIRNELFKTIVKTIAAKSKLTEEDALELRRKIKSGRFEKLQKEGKDLMLIVADANNL